MKASTWKTVRVFISSTFRDMQAERDWLVKRVFPALRQRLETHRIHLVDIDLRWGITRQQADNDQVLALCLQQIDDCRPFFLGLLGGRYGWVPSKFPVEVGKRYGWTQRHTGKSVTELEILHGVLNDPAMHRRALFCFRSDRCLASIANEQQRRVFVEGATEEELRELGREEAERRAAKRRNQLQELKQRIKKLSPPMPLFDGYPCLWQPGSSQRQEALTSLPKPVTEKNEPHDVGRYGRVGRIVGLTEFGNWVIEKLEQAILNAPELQEHLIAARTETRDELAEERDFHERFIENRTRFYIGRQQLQDELKAFVTGTEAKPCLVTGPSGSGKSAALATFVGVWRTQNPQEVVIPHFVGASPRSTNLREMLRHLCAELKDAFTLEDEIKQDVRELSDQFREFLNNVPADRRVLLVLDALDQLDETDNAHSLYCLPTQMPPQVRLIVSCIDDPDRPDQQALVAMRHRTPHEIKVGLLTDDERLGILCEIPSVAAKTLDTNQIGLLLQNPATKNPLFLLVALEELRGFGSFEELNRRIAGLPQTGDTLTAIFHQVIRRLDEDFNEVTVKKVLTLLACSRRGLSERELLDLIEGDQVRIEESAGDLFPILRQLRPYMQSRGPLLDFYHRHLAKAIHEEFFKEDAPLTPSLSPSDEQRVSARRGEERSTASSEVQGSKRPSLCQTTHQRLADYFARCAKGIDSAHEWETDSVRGFAECVFHFSRTGGHDQAVGLLTSFPFLLHKLRVGLLEGLFEDYGILYREAPSDVAKRLEVWAAFFREKAHILRRGYEEWPAHKILLQLAVEHADDSPVTQDAERWLAKRRCDWVWLRRNWRLERTCVSPCVSVLEGHSSTSKGLAIITDGGGRAATIGGALVLRDHRIISWANNDSNLRIWDPNDGRCLAVLEGHSGMVCGARTFADGRILSWASDYTLRLWDNINCTCMHVFEGHRNVVEGALVLPDGRILSWARTMFESTLGKDNTLRIWDVNSGNCLTIFTGHATEVRGALVLPNDRILSWEKDNALHLWDRNSGKRQAVLHGHTSNVKGAVALLDGTLLSWADEPTLRLWDASTAKCLAVLEGHSGLVRGALSLSDGRILSWCGDHTLRLWDSRNRKCLAVLQGHANPAVGALTLADGRILSWSQDHTLRIWDSSSGECLTVLDGHTSCVNGALVLTGGDILSWSSDRTLRRWDSNGGKCLAVLEGHSSKVHGALALPDGKVASWADQEDTLRLWDARSQNCVVNREGHSEKVNGALAMRNENILSAL